MEIFFRIAAISVVCAISSVVILDIAFLALVRRQWIPSTSVLASVFLVSVVGLGALGLWILLKNLSIGAAVFLWVPRLTVLSFYLTGCLIYMEARSLLSRGYSLRILQDLLKNGGQADLETLKLSYGEGKGISGLITKRIQTLVNFHMLHHQGKKVGPLTPMGKGIGKAGFFWRKTLRLDRVG
jgi:hypothetical protein